MNKLISVLLLSLLFVGACAPSKGPIENTVFGVTPQQRQVLETCKTSNIYEVKIKANFSSGQISGPLYTKCQEDLVYSSKVTAYRVDKEPLATPYWTCEELNKTQIYDAAFVWFWSTASSTGTWVQMPAAVLQTQPPFLNINDEHTICVQLKQIKIQKDGTKGIYLFVEVAPPQN